MKVCKIKTAAHDIDQKAIKAPQNRYSHKWRRCIHVTSATALYQKKPRTPQLDCH